MADREVHHPDVVLLLVGDDPIDSVHDGADRTLSFSVQYTDVDEVDVAGDSVERAGILISRRGCAVARDDSGYVGSVAVRIVGAAVVRHEANARYHAGVSRGSAIEVLAYADAAVDDCYADSPAVQPILIEDQSGPGGPDSKFVRLEDEQVFGDTRNAGDLRDLSELRGRYAHRECIEEGEP